MPQNGNTERDAPASGLSGTGFLGAPLRLEFERTVDGEITPGVYEDLAETIRNTLSAPGHVSTLGKSFEWHSANPQRGLRVTITPRAGRTVIRIEERFGNVLGGLMGGMVGGLGFGGGGAAIGVIGGAFHQMGLGLAAAGVLIVGSLVLARTIFRGVVHRHARELGRLVDALVEQTTAR